jgi:hypothetical protein
LLLFFEFDTGSYIQYISINDLLVSPNILIKKRKKPSEFPFLPIQKDTKINVNLYPVGEENMNE